MKGIYGLHTKELEKRMTDKNNILEKGEFKADSGMSETEKQLRSYIKENLSKGYSIESIRDVLSKSFHDETLVDHLIEKYAGVKEEDYNKYASVRIDLKKAP